MPVTIPFSVSSRWESSSGDEADYPQSLAKIEMTYIEMIRHVWRGAEIFREEAAMHRGKGRCILSASGKFRPSP